VSVFEGVEIINLISKSDRFASLYNLSVHCLCYTELTGFDVSDQVPPVTFHTWELLL